MRLSALFAFIGLTIVPGFAAAQSAPATATTSPMTGTASHSVHHWKHGRHNMMKKWHAKFDAANTSHDGHLTLAQAQAAGLKPFVDHFAEIDAQHRGYVTFNEAVAWRMDAMAKHLEQKAAALRAKD